MKVKVKEGWQLGEDGGKVHQPGEVFDAPKELAEAWIAAGQATAVKAGRPKAKAVKSVKNKSVTSKETPNKATTMAKAEE